MLWTRLISRGMPALRKETRRGYAFLPFEITPKHRAQFKSSTYHLLLWCLLGSASVNLLWRRQEHEEWVGKAKLRMRRLEESIRREEGLEEEIKVDPSTVMI